MIYSKFVFIKAKLEAEFESIAGQNEERFDIQSKDFESLQESIVAMTYDVDEIRRNKSSLELEIIIYRQLLEAGGIEISHTVTHRPPSVPTTSGATRKISIRKQKKGWIGISKCEMKNNIESEC